MKDIPARASAVITGAGIVGNGLACHLARLGWRDLVLVDKGPMPKKITCTSAGSAIRRAWKNDSHAIADVALIQKTVPAWRPSRARPARSRTAAIGRKTSVQSVKAVSATARGCTCWKSAPKYTSRPAARPTKTTDSRNPVVSRFVVSIATRVYGPGWRLGWKGAGRPTATWTEPPSRARRWRWFSPFRCRTPPGWRGRCHPGSATRPAGSAGDHLRF